MVGTSVRLLTWSVDDFALSGIAICSITVPRVFLDKVIVRNVSGRAVSVRAVFKCDARLVLDLVEQRFWDVYACLRDYVELNVASVSSKSIDFNVRFVKPLGKRGKLLLVSGNVEELVGAAPLRDLVVDAIVEGVRDGVCVRVGDENPYVFASVDVCIGDRLEELLHMCHLVDLPEVTVTVCRESVSTIVLGNVVKQLDAVNVLVLRSVDLHRRPIDAVLVPDACMYVPDVVYRMNMPTLMHNVCTIVQLLDHGLDLAWLVMPSGYGRTLTLVKTMLETVRRGGSTIALYVRARQRGRVEPYRYASVLLPRLRGWKRQMFEQYLNVKTFEDAIELATKYDVALVVDDFENVLSDSEVLKRVVRSRCQIFAILGETSHVRYLYRGHIVELKKGLTIGDVKTFLRLLNFRDIDLLGDEVYRRLVDIANGVPKRFVEVLRNAMSYCRDRNIETSLLSTVLKYVPYVL